MLRHLTSHQYVDVYFEKSVLAGLLKLMVLKYSDCSRIALNKPIVCFVSDTDKWKISDNCSNTEHCLLGSFIVT